MLNREPSNQEIWQALDRFYPNIPSKEVSTATKQIQNILKVENRHLLHIFSLDRDKNVAETIFKAIFTGRYQPFKNNMKLILNQFFNHSYKEEKYFRTIPAQF